MFIGSVGHNWTFIFIQLSYINMMDYKIIIPTYNQRTVMKMVGILSNYGCIASTSGMYQVLLTINTMNKESS